MKSTNFIAVTVKDSRWADMLSRLMDTDECWTCGAATRVSVSVSEDAWPTIRLLTLRLEAYHMTYPSYPVRLEYACNGIGDALEVEFNEWDDVRSALRHSFDLGGELADYFSPLPAVDDDHHNW